MDWTLAPALQLLLTSRVSYCSGTPGDSQNRRPDLYLPGTYSHDRKRASEISALERFLLQLGAVGRHGLTRLPAGWTTFEAVGSSQGGAWQSSLLSLFAGRPTLMAVEMSFLIVLK